MKSKFSGKQFYSIILLFCLVSINVTISNNFLFFLFQSRTSEYNNSLKPKIQSESNSVIILIGDGMGLEQIQFASLIEYDDAQTSSLFQFPYNTTISTTNIDDIITDSAAAATAISTGIKTRNGCIATNWNGNMNLTTILEIAKEKGYNTGLIATSHLSHATPACFAAHQRNRNNYQAIAQDILETEVDLMFGGGSDDAYLGNTISTYISRNYSYITSKIQMNSVVLPVLGLFCEGSFPRIQDLPENRTIPLLSEMTHRAIEIFTQQSEPFFLMIEASQIDWAGHDNDAVYLAHQMIEFEKTVQIVRQWANNISNLQVLVTADHETGGFSYLPNSIISPIPDDFDNWTSRIKKRTARVSEIQVFWQTSSHTTTKVLLTGMGPYTEQIQQASHHIDTFSIMRQAIDGHSSPIDKNVNVGYVSYQNWMIIGLIFVTTLVLSITIIISIKSKKSGIFGKSR